MTSKSAPCLLAAGEAPQRPDSCGDSTREPLQEEGWAGVALAGPRRSDPTVPAPFAGYGTHSLVHGDSKSSLFYLSSLVRGQLLIQRLCVPGTALGSAEASVRRTHASGRRRKGTPSSVCTCACRWGAVPQK